MARTQWLVDGRRIAMKVKNATCLSNLQRNWRSDTNLACPNCNHKIDYGDMAHEWPGLPAGVKFDPSDQELLEHLAAKIGIGNARPHVFIDEFILTLESDHGICYTHPEELPGVKQDGRAIHFFHRTAKAYTTGTRKRRKIHGARDDVRWHKTGKTRPVFENGEQKGCKKIMVLYMTSAKCSKADKTNWVMHQYHLGTREDEEDGEFVVSKVFYQKQQRQMEKDETEVPQKDVGTCITKGDPVTPKTSAPAPPRSGKCFFNLDVIEEDQMHCMDSSGQVTNIDPVTYQYSQSNEAEHEKLNDLTNATSGNSAWCAGEFQCLDDSQQLMDESFFCDEMLENHSSEEKNGGENCVPSLPESGRIRSDEVEKDLHHQPDAGCIPSNEFEKDLHHQPDASPELANIELDTPPDVLFTDSQFSSQESVLGWLQKNTDWLANDKSFSKPGESLGDSQCSM